jgi:predicted Zn-dependent protease
MQTSFPQGWPEPSRPKTLSLSNPISCEGCKSTRLARTKPVRFARCFVSFSHNAFIAAAGFLITLGSILERQANAAPDPLKATPPEALIETHDGTVTCLASKGALPVNAINGFPLFANGQVNTFEYSKASIRMTKGQNLIELGELSKLDILPPKRSGTLLSLFKGFMYYLGDEKANEVQIDTPHATGGPSGTEFAVIVESNRTIFAMFDGTAALTNKAGKHVVLGSGQMGIVTNGQDPVIEPLVRTNIVQWWLYYPAIIDPNELQFSPAEQSHLSSSLRAYTNGDLRGALTAYPGYPAVEEPNSEVTTIYVASLYLGVGQVGKAQRLLKRVKESSVSEALNWMIKAVQGDTKEAAVPHTSASEWLGLSYYYQARHELKKALVAAQTSVQLSTNFAFGWQRLAELEFCFGRSREARFALEKCVKMAPSFAQAEVLHGFVFSAENRLKDARVAFERGMQLDPSLGDAWLGRALIRIRTGNIIGGREDLQVATLLDPGRSLLRSYLGKAFAAAGQNNIAQKVLAYAKQLDENDPTPWFYSALIEREENRINQSVLELEESIKLNNNRAVYRSQYLLDEDRAARSSSLAEVFRSAGLENVSLAEATRSVNYEYANYSAHQFLAESYDALRDPTRFNLRYETVWFNELLLADLFSPVGGTPLSQHISQQEYSRLFDQDRVGLTSSTEYRSDGQLRELASQFGYFGNTGWSLDLDFQHNNGVRKNNDLDRIEWYSTFKQQLTARDSVLLLTKYQEYHSGDNFQYFDPTNASPYFRFDETQAPIVVGGYHHEWQPGVDTLLLGGRLENEQEFTNKQQVSVIVPGPINSQVTDDFNLGLKDKLEIFTAELQQIFQTEHQMLIVGARWQGGDFSVQSIQDNLFTNFTKSTVDEFGWLSGYAYETLRFPLNFNITGGFAYEQITAPINFRAPPIQQGSETRHELNPKLGVVWHALPQMTVRGIYSQSLGGESLDESFRLESAQLAGFPQAFRTIIPESLVGSVTAPEHQILGMAIDLKLSSNTYVEFLAEKLGSEVRQRIGLFERSNSQEFPISVKQSLDYDETDLRATVNQLISPAWSLGASYAFTRSNLRESWAEFSDARPPSKINADLHQFGLAVLYNHSSGFFAGLHSDWYFQNNSKLQTGFNSYGEVPAQLANQLNLEVGFRFSRQRGDFAIGGMNLADQDYHLNPVTPIAELPRERVFFTRLRLRF